LRKRGESLFFYVVKSLSLYFMSNFLCLFHRLNNAEDIDYRIGAEFDKMRRCFLDTR
jgi:hypothetical protein